MPNDSFAKIQETKSSKETNTLFSRIFSFADTDSLINLTSTNKALKNEVEKKEAPLQQLLLHKTVIKHAAFFKDESRSSLKDVRKYSGGLTNNNFYFKTKLGHPFMARHAGKGSHKIIDRASEHANIAIINRIGIGAEVVYNDEKSGHLITKFLVNSESLLPRDFRDLSLLQKSTSLLKKLHTHTEAFKNEFNIFDLARKMKLQLDEEKVQLPEIYRKCAPEIAKIESLLNTLEIKKVPCHNDPNPYNFLLMANGDLKLIDWEYAGNNDPMMDLADLSLEAGFNKDQDLVLFKMYFGDKWNESDYQRFVLYKPVIEFWWALWARKQLLNEIEPEKVGCLYGVEKRINVCLDLIEKSDEFRNAFDGLVNLTEPRPSGSVTGPAKW